MNFNIVPDYILIMLNESNMENIVYHTAPADWNNKLDMGKFQTVWSVELTIWLKINVSLVFADLQ